MLHVKTPQEVLEIIRNRFGPNDACESVPIAEACGRTIKENIVAQEYVPGFTRSTVDGYAVRAADTFGCSDSMPSILLLAGEVKMGEAAGHLLQPGSCMAVPTGGDLPEDADAVVMVEFTEDYGDGTIGILKPVAPGNNLIYRGDDISPGKVLLPAGHTLAPHDIGSLAALGIATVKVQPKPVVGIISTGDELVEINEKPGRGQVRNVNSCLLEAVIHASGGQARSYGIIRDNESLLLSYVQKAVAECDLVLISGGSSVGMKDATARVIQTNGTVLVHGIAIKPGKPTILGVVDGKGVFGLPGHPVAAYLTALLFVRPLIGRLLGTEIKQYALTASISETISSNHGREEYIGVFLEKEGEQLIARPIRGKSGLITSLAGSDGYICIPRDCEGLAQGAQVQVYLWR